MKTLDEIIKFFEDEEYELQPKRVSEEYFEDLKEYACKDDIVAQFAICNMYGSGEYVELNDAMAEKWLNKMLKTVQKGNVHTSSKRPNRDVHTTTGNVYALAGSINQADEDYKTANEYFKKAKRYGNPRAYRCLGINYFYGWGVKENYNTALNYFQNYFQAVNKISSFKPDYDYAFVCCLTGLIYQDEKNEKKALEYFLKGVDLGYAPCQYHAGWYFVDTDNNKFKKYIMASAENGYAPAMIVAGDCFLDGANGFNKNINSAINYYTKAIEEGTDDAEPYVELTYIYGLKEYNDPQKAIKYGEYALKNCNFYDESDLCIYIYIACAYWTLHNFDTALAYAQKAKEYGLEGADELYNDIRKSKRGNKIFGFIDTVFSNPITDMIPGVNIISKSYKLGGAIGDALDNGDANGVKNGISQLNKMLDD